MRTAFRDRIKGLAWLPRQRVIPAMQNFRTHDARQRSVLRGLLAEIGVAGAALVWVPDPRARAALRRCKPEAFAAWLEGFTGTVQLIDGHMRAEELKTQAIPVLVTDLDEREAQKALATFDAVSDLADTDKELLAQLLGEIGSAEEDGTAELLAELEKAAGVVRGGEDEEPNLPTIEEGFAVLVECKSEAEQVALLERLTREGHTVKALVS